MLIAVLAALSMMATDIIAVVEVQAEAANRGWMAGWADVFAWLVSIACTTISVSVLSGHHSFTEKATVVLLVSAANLFGTKLGQILGSKLLKTSPAADSAFTAEQHAELMHLIATAAQSGR